MYIETKIYKSHLSSQFISYICFCCNQGRLDTYKYFLIKNKLYFVFVLVCFKILKNVFFLILSIFKFNFYITYLRSQDYKIF